MKDIKKPYDRHEVMKETLKYFSGDDLASNVWIDKYALKNNKGDLYESSPKDMHKRIASELARIEAKYPNGLLEDEIFELLDGFKYIVPQGSPMAGIGNDFQITSLSNCYVIGNNNNSDSYGSIMRSDENMAQLMKRRGGVGHDISHLRPIGCESNNAVLDETAGAPLFMERYSYTTREVAQSKRRGALMLSISIKHPDSANFIDKKMVDGKVTGANISVKITDEFMNCVIEDKDYIQTFPIDLNVTDIPSDLPYNVLHECEGGHLKKIKAKELWGKIVFNAHQSAEPGILFWDTIIRESNGSNYGDEWKEVSTNPCGEIPLNPFDSCRLLLLNLFSYVINPFTKDATFNMELFKDHVRKAQRFMDDIVDLEIEKLDKIISKIESDPEPDDIKSVELNLWENIRSRCIDGRRTGLGITAEGDMLAALGIKYGSEEGIEFSTNIHKQMAIESYSESIILAEERGSFTIWEYEIDKNAVFVDRILNMLSDDMVTKYKEFGRRNISNLTIAPAGSVSILTQTTSGIEPVFLPTYKRRRKTTDKSKITFTDNVGDTWEEFNVFHHNFKRWFDVNKIELGYSDDITINTLGDTEINELVKKSPYFNATSNDVNWVNKVRLQGSVQRYVDHSISVTTNLPSDATIDIVNNVYMTAWESGCKGMTIYRDGCRDGVLISNEKNKKVSDIIKDNNAPKRPKKLECDVLTFKNNNEKWIGFIGLYGDDEEKKPYEIFTGILDSFSIPSYIEKGWIVKEKDNGTSRYDFMYLDKDGYEQTMKGLNRAFDPHYWNISKMLSGVLRHGMPIPSAYNLLDTLCLEDGVTSWKNGVKRMFKKYIKDGTKAKSGKCPNCGSENFKYQDGCPTCMDCGYGQC